MKDTTEIRCGYVVTTQLRKIWNIELDLMARLLSVCEKYDIKVFAFSGTLLGAVRHQGFIPWDDDMDFAMSRNDFEKLLLHAEEFENPYFLQHAENDRAYFLDYARLRNSNTTGIITWNASADYNNGIFIDIYVLDGVPETAFALKRQFFCKKFYRGIFKTFYKKNDGENVCHKILRVIGKTQNYEYWIRKYNKNLSKYTSTASCIGLMTHNYKEAKKYKVRKSDAENITWIDFEDTRIPILTDYETFLKSAYGNYMEFPPIEERGQWHNNQIVFDPDCAYKDYFERMERNKKED